MASNPHLDLRRHMELFDADAFDSPVHIIGAGATGSWLVMELAKLGITNITVWDFDTIEEHNVPNQLYGIKDVGRYKVEVLAQRVLEETGLQIKVKSEPYAGQRLAGYVFMMIDTMSGRKEFWEKNIKMKSAIKHYIEPRMGLDMCRIYNVDPMNRTHHAQYESTLYSDEEAEVSACGTSMSVISTALVTAGYCARQLINHTSTEEDLIDNEILLDLKYNNLITNRW